MRVLAVMFFLSAIPQAAFAQYCMLDDSGGRTCGIATLQQCEQTRAGVGGSCEVDDSAHMGLEVPDGASGTCGDLIPVRGDPFDGLFIDAQQNSGGFLHFGCRVDTGSGGEDSLGRCAAGDQEQCPGCARLGAHQRCGFGVE